MPFTQLSRDTRMSIIKWITARGVWESERPGSLHCGHLKLEYTHRASNRESGSIRFRPPSVFYDPQLQFICCYIAPYYVRKQYVRLGGIKNLC